MSAWTRTLAVGLALALTAIPAPATAAEPDGIADPGLRSCIAAALGVPSVPEFSAAQLGGITKLRCDGHKGQAIGDLTGIEKLTSLEYLTLDRQTVADLTPLDGLPILGLSLSRSTLADLPALRLPQLVALDLSDATGPSLTLLTDLPALNRIFLAGASFPDFEKLGSLPPLQQMTVGRTGATDFTGLSEVVVDELWFSDDELTSLPDLGHSPGVGGVWLAGAKLRDLSSLAGWSSLRKLSLNTPEVNDISVVSGLTGLTDFRSYGAKFSDLRVFPALKSLTTLQVEDQGITDLSPLAGLTRLSSARLGWNQIADLRPLAGLKSLATLRLERNQISDLSPLAGLTKLTELALSDNRVVDLRSLAGLTSLIDLELDRNGIRDVSSLRGLVKLELLDLETNRVEDVRPLAGLPKATHLNLTRNAILDLSPLIGHTGQVSAADQYRELGDATFSVPYPIAIVGINGKAPTMHFSEGGSYRDGKLHYALAGPQEVRFSTSGDTATAFAGRIVQRVGPTQQFNKPKLTVRSAPVVGATVTASYSTAWRPTPTGVHYQWYRDWKPIPGATKQSYLVTAKDVGHRLQVLAVAYRDGYEDRHVQAPDTGKVRRATFESAARPKISGVAKTGQKLTVKVPERKPAATKVSYQWYRNSKKISKATKSSYTLTAADKGKRISVRVTYQAPGIETDRAYSKKTAKVAAGPVRSAEPTVAGAVVVGERVTVKAGSWGPGTVKLRYQWRRDDQPIKGATGRSYRLVAKDGGQLLSVVVTGSRKGYRTVVRVSAAYPVLPG